MNTKTADSLLRCHRPGMPADVRIEKAVRAASADPDLKRQLDEQAAFDSRITDAIHELAPPDGLAERLDAAHAAATAARPDWRATLRQPPLLAAGIGLLVIVGYLAVVGMDQMKSFPGKPALEQIIEDTAGMSGLEMEPVSTEVGKLPDWFAVYGLENLDVPREFASFKTVGCRVFRAEGDHRVVQIAVEKHHLLLFVLRAADFGVKAPARWHVFAQGEWTAAVRGQGETAFMIAFRGTELEMKKFLTEEAKATFD